MITHNDKEMLESSLEMQETMSYDFDTDMVTIDFTVDVETVWDEYTRNMLLKKFLQREIDLRYELIYDYEVRDYHTEYEMMGFIYNLHRQGDVVELPYTELMEHIAEDE